MKNTLIVLIAVVVLTSAGQSSAQMQKITLGDVAPVAAAWPAMVADDFGYFKDEGLDVSTVYTGNNAMVAQQVVGGSLDLGVTTVETAIRAIEGGATMQIVASEMLKYPYSMMAPAQIQKAEDIKGKRVILALPKSAPTVFWNRWLAEHGMKPADAEQVYDGSTPNRFAALQSGTVQAALLTQPFDQVAREKGYHVLVDIGQYAKEFGFTIVVASKKTIEQRPDAIRHFVKAMARGIATIYDPSQKAKVIAALTKRAKIDPKSAEQTYDYYTKDLHPFVSGAKVPPAYVQSVISLLVDVGDFKPADRPVSRYLNTSFH